jgi:SAM-dependent methyltransferase
VTREPWDEIVESWRGTRRDAVLRNYSDAVNAALLRRWLPAVNGRRVLKTDLFDEAVGKGLYPTLSSLGASVAGVDISPTAVTAARRRYPELDATIGDVRALPHPDAAFDAVVSNSTLDHFASVAEIETALRELQRVLVPGGVLVVTLDNPLNPLVALRNALPFGLLRRIGLVPYPFGATCSHRRLATMLDRTGFELTASEAVMHVPRILAAVFPLGGLLTFERLSRWPTRYITGQFVAARALRI